MTAKENPSHAPASEDVVRTPPHPQQVQIFRATATPEDFKNANVGDWIQGVGEISTEYEKEFIRRFGGALSTTSAAGEVEKVLDELEKWLKNEIKKAGQDTETWLDSAYENVLEMLAELRQQWERGV